MYTEFLIIKQTRCTNFSNLFWNETLHVLDSSSIHHQEFFTAHTAMVYIIQVCWQLASRISSSILILLGICQQNCMPYTIAMYSEKIYKYIKSVLWRVAKRLSYIEDARCLKVKVLKVFIISVTAQQQTPYLQYNKKHK